MKKKLNVLFCGGGGRAGGQEAPFTEFQPLEPNQAVSAIKWTKDNPDEQIELYLSTGGQCPEAGLVFKQGMLITLGLGHVRTKSLEEEAKTTTDWLAYFEKIKTLKV